MTRAGADIPADGDGRPAAPDGLAGRGHGGEPGLAAPMAAGFLAAGRIWADDGSPAGSVGMAAATIGDRRGAAARRLVLRCRLAGTILIERGGGRRIAGRHWCGHRPAAWTGPIA